MMKIWVVSLLSAFILGSCASLDVARHQLIMRGQILEVEGDRAYVCVGTADGAEAGQVLQVVRFVRRQGGSPRRPFKYEMQRPGTVEIVEVVDEHFAWSERRSGTFNEGDMVELRR